MTISITHVRHDPFARISWHREARTNPLTMLPCKWCGTQRRTLFYYMQESDATGCRQLHETRTGGVMLGRIEGFCNLQCHDDYHS